MTQAVPTNARLFDLNIERILEAWEDAHAVREIIANALDEQVLSGTGDVEIAKDQDGRWTIRDRGRGLRYEHLTQNESPEKIRAVGRVIGKFGVGLKDAVAALDRHGVAISFESRHGRIAFEQCGKHGFSDVVTLHARVVPPYDDKLEGTVATFDGLADREMAKAKDFFLRFTGEREIELTKLGSILEKRGAKGRIYVAGLLIAEEENFAFSYNITSLTQSMRKALNRERTNVGRTAYSDRVKALLLASSSPEVAEALASELVRLQSGEAAEEVRWKDVAVHACRILNKGGNCVFVTAGQLSEHASAVDDAKTDGKRIIVVPDAIYDEIAGGEDLNGEPMFDLGTFQTAWSESFVFDWVEPEDLEPGERSVFDKTDAIASLVGGMPKPVRRVRISHTMRPNVLSAFDAVGLWDAETKEIVIRRDQLASLGDFAGALLHEIAHVRSGASDLTPGFEEELSDMLGLAAETALAEPRDQSSNDAPAMKPSKSKTTAHTS